MGFQYHGTAGAENSDSSFLRSRDEHIQLLLSGLDLLLVIRHTVDCHWMVFQYHGTAIAEEWRDLMTEYYQLVNENIV